MSAPLLRLLACVALALLVVVAASGSRAQDADAGKAAPSSTTREGDLSSLAERIRPSIVGISLFDVTDQSAGTGSGFIVSKTGRVLTNFHVIDGAARAEALLSGGARVKVLGVLAADPERDLAVLQLAPGDYTPLTLGSTADVKPGTEVLIIGAPRGLQETLSTGVLSAVRDAGVEGSELTRSWQLQHTAPISPGSSGSPIIRRANGLVIGVAVGMRTGGQALNFGVPIEAAKDLLATIEVGTQPQPLSSSGRSVGDNLLISLVGIVVAGLLILGISRVLRRRQARS